MINNPIFPTDVLIEILLRLPVKQVGQLKILSKQWLFIISSPHFKILYNERSIKRPLLLVVEESYEGHTAHEYFGPLSRTLHMSTIDIPTGVIKREFSKDVHGRTYYNFIFGCNLVCYNIYGHYSICNPITREHVYLLNGGFPALGYYCVYLQQTNEYKIINAFGPVHCKAEKVRFKILTLKDGEPIPRSWKIVENSTPKWSHEPEFVSLKCSIYWFINSRKLTEKSIISMDLNTEKFSTISYPEVLSEPQDYRKVVYRYQLTEIKGELCVAQFSERHSTVGIFVLKDHESSTWVKECRIYLPNMEITWIDIVGYFPCDEKNGEIIINCSEGTLMSYNINDKSIRRLGHSEIPRRCHVSLYYDRLFSFGVQKENAEDEEEKEDKEAEKGEEGSLDVGENEEGDQEEESSDSEDEEKEEEESSDSEQNEEEERSDGEIYLESILTLETSNLE